MIPVLFHGIFGLISYSSDCRAPGKTNCYCCSMFSIFFLSPVHRSACRVAHLCINSSSISSARYPQITGFCRVGVQLRRLGKRSGSRFFLIKLLLQVFVVTGQPVYDRVNFSCPALASAFLMSGGYTPRENKFVYSLFIHFRMDETSS